MNDTQPATPGLDDAETRPYYVAAACAWCIAHHQDPTNGGRTSCVHVTKRLAAVRAEVLAEVEAALADAPSVEMAQLVVPLLRYRARTAS